MEFGTDIVKQEVMIGTDQGGGETSRNRDLTKVRGLAGVILRGRSIFLSKCYDRVGTKIWQWE